MEGVLDLAFHNFHDKSVGKDGFQTPVWELMKSYCCPQFLIWAGMVLAEMQLEQEGSERI